MATVASSLTRVNDLEGAVTTAVIGSGGGASVNTDIFLQATQSVARRRSNVVLEGFWIDDTVNNDVSAADVHVGAWVWVTQYASLTALQLWFGTSTTNYDQHALDLAEFPDLGGWVRMWVDVSRTPTATGGTGLNEAQLRYVGLVVSLPAVGGTSPNVVIDAIDFTTTGLSLTGTTGLWSDFVTADANTTNQYGVLRSISGILYCYARLTLGTASSLVFDDSSFTLVFVQQALVNDTFMGISIDLQNASTDIAWANGVIRSAGTKRGDLVVTSTSGAFAATACVFAALRIITFTSACSAIDCVFSDTGQVTGAGADLSGSTFSGYEGTADTSLLVWDAATDPDGLFDNTAFTKGTAATHAIEFGTTSPTTMTLQGIVFSGYNASNTNNDSTFHIKRTSGTVTINLIGCSGNMSYRSDGATVVLVLDPVTSLITVRDENDDPLQNARVLVEAGDGTGDLKFEASVTITHVTTTASVAHTAHGYSSGQKVVIRGANQSAYNGVFAITNPTTNAYDYVMGSDPGTNATGTITSTGVIVEGLTNASGQVSASRSYSVDQTARGRIRMSTSSPRYKAFPPSGYFTDVVDNVNGLTKSVSMIRDD